FRNEVQVIITVLSFDGVNDPAMVGFVGASAALSISSVPWAGPIGVAQVAKVNGAVVVNPIMADLENADLDLVVAATKELVPMIEAEARQVPDEEVYAAIKTGFEANQV